MNSSDTNQPVAPNAGALAAAALHASQISTHQPDPVATDRNAEDYAATGINLTKTYGTGDTAVTALRNVTVRFVRGEFTAIMGPSGSGKSTLMHCMAGLDTADSGDVWFGNENLTLLNDDQLTCIRRDRIGFVFQAFNLVPTLTARQNILLPLELAGRKIDPEWFNNIVDILGIRDRLSHTAAQMSGGQQQRVAIARALATQPDAIFADEPTGNLDSFTGSEVLTLLRDCARSLKQTVVIVTHDPVAASYADRVILLADGAIATELTQPTADTVLAALKELHHAPRTKLTTATVEPPAPHKAARTSHCEVRAASVRH